MYIYSKYWIYEHTNCRRSISRALRDSRWLSIKTYITRCTMQNVIPSSQCVHGGVNRGPRKKCAYLFVGHVHVVMSASSANRACRLTTCATHKKHQEKKIQQKSVCVIVEINDWLTDWQTDLWTWSWRTEQHDWLTNCFFHSSGACRFCLHEWTMYFNLNIFHFEEINTNAQFYYKKVKRCSKAFEFIINIRLFICNKVIDMTTAKLTKWQYKHLVSFNVWVSCAQFV